MELMRKRRTISGETGRTRKFLVDAGLTAEEIRDIFDLNLEDRTRWLVARYDSRLGGRQLGGLMKAIVNLGGRERVADFLVGIIKGPPVPAQLLALRAAERPEFRTLPAVDEALKCYQGDFASLTEAYSWYSDPERCGCGRGGCGDQQMSC